MITGKLFLLLVLNIVITLCSACRGDDEKHIDYSLFAESVDSRAEITDSSAVPDSERRQEGKAEMKGQEDNKEQAEQKEEPESWFSAIEFSGVRSEKTDYAIGNLGSNMKADSYVICYVCPDAANDAVYYVNLYGDNYIYRIKNGKRTLLSEVKAHNLQLWDNKLYFIKVDNEINPYSYNPGPLCSFDLISKEMKEVLDRNIISFFIDSYGIFFRELSDNNEVCMYKADFNHTVAKMEGCSWVLAYNEYLLTGKDDGISLVNRDTGEAVKLMTGMDDIANTLCISDDSLIFAKEAYIYLINLKTGEKSVYDANDLPGAPLKTPAVSDLACTGKDIFIAYESNLLKKVDTKTGKVNQYLTMGGMESYFYRHLQTDGKNLYAIRFNQDMLALGPEELTIPPEPGNLLERRRLWD